MRHIVLGLSPTRPASSICRTFASRRHILNPGSKMLVNVVRIRILCNRRQARLDSWQVTAVRDAEREVLANMAQGKTNAAIAEALVLSPRAVEKHINMILSK